jgi:CHAT domain-containing protein
LARERALAAALSVKAERRTRLLGGPHAEAQARAAVEDLERTTTAYEAVRAQIRVSSPRYAALTDHAPPGVEAVRTRLLDADTLLLEYFVGTARSYLFVVSPAEVRAYELPARRDIEAAVANLYRETRQPGAAPSGAGAANTLGRLLLGPVADRLDRQRLAIVAGGDLEFVPFAALINPRHGRPLVSDHVIAMLPSASALLAARSIAPAAPGGAARSLAIFADPVFSADDPRVDATSRGRTAARPPAVQRSLQLLTDEGAPAVLDRLLGSRREATAIAAVFPPGRVTQALGFDATRSAATAADLGAHDVVHFATHAFLNARQPALSGIVLSRVDRRGEPQNGFVGLGEIFNLRLRSQLVVLSACQTALGAEIRGEGLVGLARAFMYAGAPRVVASLWKVDDAATAELMTRFYRAMLGPQRLPPATALAEAQRALQRDRRWRAPYYWAAFVLQGDWQ